MPSKKGYLIPEIINPPTRRCVKIFVPDDLRWWAAFWGQITDLVNAWNWEGTPAQQAEVTEIWNEVLLSARQNWIDGDCELPLEFRVVNNRVEYRPDGAAAWVDIGEACGCGSPYTAPEYNPDAPDFETRACAIAVGLIVWLMEKYNDTLDAIEATADTVSAMDAILAIFPPAYLIADVILDTINEVIEAGVGVARAYDTVGLREDMQEWLYCRMTETGEMTAELWMDFKDAFEAEEFAAMTPGGIAMLAYLKTFETEAILSRARIESYGSQNCAGFNCADAGEWFYEWDFVADNSLQGWEQRRPTQPLPTPTVDGLQASSYVDTAATPDDGRRGVIMKHDLDYADSTTRLTQMETTWSAITACTNCNASADGNYVRTETAGLANIDITSAQAIPGAGGTVINVFNPGFGYSPTDSIHLFGIFAHRLSNTGQPPNGNGYVQQIVVRGTGKNPFVP